MPTTWKNSLVSLLDTTSATRKALPAGPILVLSAYHGPELTISWDWLYRVGSQRIRAPLGPSELACRDPDREREIVASLGIPIAGLMPYAVLDGVDTAWFVSEVLPMLQDHPAVVVDIEGPYEVWP